MSLTSTESSLMSPVQLSLNTSTFSLAILLIELKESERQARTV
jgi:hypothetical protein